MRNKKFFLKNLFCSLLSLLLSLDSDSDEQKRSPGFSRFSGKNRGVTPLVAAPGVTTLVTPLPSPTLFRYENSFRSAHAVLIYCNSLFTNTHICMEHGVCNCNIVKCGPLANIIVLQWLLIWLLFSKSLTARWCCC